MRVPGTWHPSSFLLNHVREMLNLNPSFVGDLHEQEAGVLPQQEVHRHLFRDEWTLHQQ